MKKYDFRQKIMFYMYENDIEKFVKDVSAYFEKELKTKLVCEGIKNEKLVFNFKSDDLYLKLSFLYDDSLFEYCYTFNGSYDCNVYKGSRNIINKLYWYLRDNYQIITKKEPLYCTDCNEQIGWIYNDIDDFNDCCGDYYNSVSGFNKSKEYEKNLLEPEDVIRCIKCGDFYCEDCADINYEYESSYNYICNNCSESEFNEYKNSNCNYDCLNCDYDDDCHYEENTIDRWGSCEFDEDDERYQKCDDCENFDDCLESAQDNRDGYSSFCDIVSDAYGSVDAFWECNGI